MTAKARRTRFITLRADDVGRSMIDRAAEALGKNRSEFVLDAGTREAMAVLLDRVFFQLKAQAFNRFVAVLDGAPLDPTDSLILRATVERYACRATHERFQAASCRDGRSRGT